MLLTLGVVLLISFLVSLISMRDFHADKEYGKIKSNLRKEQIRGGIVFKKGEKPKHYSSYSL
jgi:hypothetical protein